MTHSPASSLFDTAFEALRAPENVLTDGTWRCTYGELPMLIRHARKCLDEAGCTPDDFLALRWRNTVAHLIILLALIERRHCFVLTPAGTAAAAHTVPRCCSRVVDVPVEVDFSTRADLDSALSSIVVTGLAPASKRNDLPSVVCLLTSGSTGRPKLIAHAIDHLVKNAAMCVERFALTQEDRVMIPVPVCHMYGLGAALLPAVLAGASVAVLESPNAIRYWDQRRRFDATVPFVTPSYVQQLVRVRSLRHCHRLTVSAGDVLPRSVAQTYEDRFGPVVSLYGSTELGAVAAASPDDPPWVRHTTVGTLMPGVRLRGSEDGKISGAPLPLSFDHPCGFIAALDEDGTLAFAANMCEDGYWDTSDVGQMFKGRFLQVLGRIDDLVKRDGFKVALKAVDAALTSIEGVAQCATVVGERGTRGASLHAFCVPLPQRTLSEPELQRACAGILPPYAVPDRFHVLSELPVLASGKIDRLALVERGKVRSEPLGAANPEGKPNVGQHS